MSLENQRAAFELLGIPLTADEATIRTAWRKLVRTYHPDQAAGDPEAANKRLAEINAAFDLLSARSTVGHKKPPKATAAKNPSCAEPRSKRTTQRDRNTRAATNTHPERPTKRPQKAAPSPREPMSSAAPKASAPPRTQIVPRTSEQRKNLRARRAFDAALECVRGYRETPKRSFLA